MMIRSKDMLERFCFEKPVYRRWYIARITGAAMPNMDEYIYSDERGDYIDLYFSSLNQGHYNEAKQKIDEYAKANFHDLDMDDMNWWSDEDFDTSVHLPLKEFIQFLNLHNCIHQDQNVEEGMVLIEVHHGDEFRFMHYTSQARNASKKVVQQLLHDDIKL